MPSKVKRTTASRTTKTAGKVTRTASLAKLKTRSTGTTRLEKARNEYRKMIARHLWRLDDPRLVRQLQNLIMGVENTHWEELKCVGYNPETEYLEAVVHIKQNSGYGGDVCSSGSREYVRFYLSYDNGATWEDQGVSKFTAYDVTGKKPLEYSVRLLIDPSKKYCLYENLPKVRAILSYYCPPPANTPNFKPIFGNHLDANIQIEAFKLIPFPIFLEALKIKLKPELIKVLDLEQQIKVKPPIKMEPLELMPIYLKNKVPAHRLLSKEIDTIIKQPIAYEEKLPVELSAVQIPGIDSILKGYKLDIGTILEAYLNTDGNTSWEELNCLGMCQGAIDWLTATFRVKQKYGYSGGLCDDGSYEYVAFWVDWGDGAGWTYIGTGSVNVHDLSTLPPGGVEYTVSIPVNTLAHRQPCNSGPKTVKVRAILSWNKEPLASDPNHVPVFGNREETLVLLQPGPAIVSEDNRMYVDSVGNMAVCDIDQTTGLATGAGQIAAFNANQSPFGGSVRMTGFIVNPPNVLGGDPPLKYKVSVRRSTGAGTWTGWQTVDNDFNIRITEQNGTGLPVSYNHLQEVDSNGFYTYMEQIYPNQWRQVTMDKIASWETLSLQPGLWEIKVEVKLPDNTILPPGVISCVSDGTTRSTVKVCLDEGRPDPINIRITGYDDATGYHPEIGDCGTFTKGVVIKGSYAITDPESHWGYKSIYIAPTGPAVSVIPSATGSSGETGLWAIDTSTMQPCGYTVHLWTSDKTIVNSGQIGWRHSMSVGFCLKA